VEDLFRVQSDEEQILDSKETAVCKPAVILQSNEVVVFAEFGRAPCLVILNEHLSPTSRDVCAHHPIMLRLQT